MSRNLLRIAMIGALLAGAALPARAVNPDEMLQDQALEARARVLSQDLRCVVCQNQSIDDSNAPLAHDLRVLLRERLAAGDNDQAALDYIVARYGNFVLLKPPVQMNTLALWMAPALAALFALIRVVSYLRAQSAPSDLPSPPLTAEEEARLGAYLEEKVFK